MHKDEVTTSSRNNGNTLLVAVKSAYRQYKSDLKYVKNISHLWKQKPYRFITTELSIAWHNFYWHVVKR